MSTISPVVNWTITNNNVLVQKPLLGISYVVARCQKGPVAQPDEIFTSVRRFREVYGGEVVPDGSCSNIEYALTHGSKVRVSRVKSAETVDGLVSYQTDNNLGDTDTNPTMTPLTTEVPGFRLIADGPDRSPGHVEAFIQLTVKEDAILNAYPDAQSFSLKLTEFETVPGRAIQMNFLATNEKAEISQDTSEYDILSRVTLFSRQYDENTTDETSKPGSWISYNNALMTTLSQYFYVNLFVREATGIFAGISSFEDIINTVLLHQVNPAVGNNGSIEIWNNAGTTYLGNYGAEADPAPIILTGLIYGAGVTPGEEEYIDAIDAFREYNEAYQMIISHLYQSYPWTDQGTNTETLSTIWKAASDSLALGDECQLIVSLPRRTSDGVNFRNLTYMEMINIKSQLQASLGLHEFHSYVAEGVILPHHLTGLPVASDGLGAVLGIADTSASEYGPWYSFAGPRRGIINDASGLVYENFGLKSNYEKATSLAADRICIFVQKMTPTVSRPVVMFWHNFTNSLQNNSQRFWNVQRLVYYIKKNLDPILESYLEEPNTFSTWANIYLDGKRVMDYLVANEAITRYEWQGDQFATSYDDLQINSEADVRNGIYKIILSIWDIISLQQIDIELVIAAPDSSVSIMPV